MGIPLVTKISSYIKGGVLFLYVHFIQPRSTDDDTSRREFILNVLLVASFFFSIILLGVVIFNELHLEEERRGIAPGIMAMICVAFFLLLLLSRRGWIQLASVSLLVFYFIPVTYGLYIWGADLPQGLLAYTLIIIMSSVLVGTAFSFWTTILISGTVLAITYGQIHAFVVPLSFWKDHRTDMPDGIAVAATLGVIATVSWLSNREIEKSLHRARISEADLRRERDRLEITVEERSRELKRVQMENMAHMYHFVEFGRLASGFFHDLASPLTSVSLNLERLKGASLVDVTEAQKCVEQAFRTTKRLEGFLDAVRQQMQHKEMVTSFSMIEEIEHVFQVLDHKAKQAEVRLILRVNGKIPEMHGNPYKFNKIILNLISNAIDAYESLTKTNAERTVVIELSEETSEIACSIQDRGCGIKPDHLPKIFELFFTTKGKDKGMGIGLSTTKEMIEKDFGGTIHVQSQIGVGSTFRIVFPSSPPS